jgi:hypothetical protein
MSKKPNPPASLPARPTTALTWADVDVAFNAVYPGQIPYGTVYWRTSVCARTFRPNEQINRILSFAGWLEPEQLERAYAAALDAIQESIRREESIWRAGKAEPASTPATPKLRATRDQRGALLFPKAER